MSRRTGSGTFVNHNSIPDSHSIAQHISPIELIETRLAFEPNLARLAAVNASGQDLERLAGTLERLEASAADMASFALADEQFHLQLAECRAAMAGRSASTASRISISTVQG